MSNHICKSAAELKCFTRSKSFEAASKPMKYEEGLPRQKPYLLSDTS